MRLIDAEALKAKWYKINDIDENDRGARFVGYTEIARLIDQAPTVSAETIPQGEQYKKGFEDAKRAFLLEYARESENMWKRNAQLEVMLNVQKAIAEANSVVRCKDCKQRRVEGDCTNYYYCDFLGSICGDNEYCSFGERREP